ncbi:DNA adenine methylase [Anaerococcus sp. Marseille-Q5996]|uniref:DNA adenine methylase n=1 Tax=Anaerococcus sp. Marseille-Q5996 TaxID=2972769 RepID=UPI0021C9DFD7|nr:DNA adenine methylase [Anaerococcus sp. Marseille-Q5996]
MMEIEKSSNIYPFVKWVGGKRQLANKINKLIPENYNCYFEPFVGGGAILFSLQPKKAIINDYNEELINTYRVIRDNPEQLITFLEIHEIRNNEDYFYEIRSLDRNDDYKYISDIEKAARTIYLNKTCFNGLYRVNSLNQFNAPYGKYKKPKIVDYKNIIACSNYLNDAQITISSGDYKDSIKVANENDFIYLDPPYLPVSKTSNFTSYTKNNFKYDEQIDLKNECDKLTEKGIKFLLSNSYSDIILDLYRDYEIITVDAKRAINSDPTKRGKVKEVLIRNYVNK